MESENIKGFEYQESQMKIFEGICHSSSPYYVQIYKTRSDSPIGLIADITTYVSFIDGQMPKCVECKTFNIVEYLIYNDEKSFPIWMDLIINHVNLVYEYIKDNTKANVSIDKYFLEQLIIDIFKK